MFPEWLHLQVHHQAEAAGASEDNSSGRVAQDQETQEDSEKEEGQGIVQDTDGFSADWC